jgi:ParB family chromosome partitioning protein
MAAQQHGLGRGLSSLIPPKKDGTQESPFKDMVLRAVEKESFPLSGVNTPHEEMAPPAPIVTSSGAQELPVGLIVSNPHQPRKHFDETKLSELAGSIREHGVIQPIIVTALPDGKYELIAGERRLEASKIAGKTTIPAVIREAKEQEKLEFAIIENTQRHDLNPIEEARGYVRLSEEFGLNQEAVAMKMGKSRSAIANILRLLHLPIEMQRAIAEGKITEGHAKALLSIENPEKQRALFELILKSGLTVRDAESKAREISVRPHIRRVATLSPEIAEKVERLSSAFGTKVAVKPIGKGGRIVVEYYSDEELDHIVSRLLTEK